MDKARVIELREKLKAGKNLPIRVLIDNAFEIVDESMPTQFNVWDDVNGYLYTIKMVNPVIDTVISNKGQAVSITAIDYETIQGLEICALSLDNIEAVLLNIDAGIEASKALAIKEVYRKLLDPNMAVLSADKINKLTGSNLNTKDDYYNGKYVEPSKFRDSNNKEESKEEE